MLKYLIMEWSSLETNEFTYIEWKFLKITNSTKDQLCEWLLCVYNWWRVENIHKISLGEIQQK